MVPAGSITDQTIKAVAEMFEAGDVIIDGGNTHYHDDIRHAAELRKQGIHHVYCRTSGGVCGLERGFCLMIGGEDEIVQRLAPLFATIAQRGRSDQLFAGPSLTLACSAATPGARKPGATSGFDTRVCVGALSPDAPQYQQEVRFARA